MQPARQLSVLHVPNAAASKNSAKVVVVVAGVLGLETAGVVVTQTLITLGPRASGSAKHGQSRRQSLVNGHTLPNSHTHLPVQT